MLTIMDISQTPEIVRYEGETLVAMIKAQVEKTSSAYASYVSSVSDSVIFGATNPIRFLAMVQDWNEAIRRNAITNVKMWLQHSANLNNQFTYGAKNWMAEADDMFTPSGFHCIISKEHGYDRLHTVLSNEQMQEMCKNPQNYIIANVTFDI